jgi:xylan 1,4-beta-xylosidase
LSSDVRSDWEGRISLRSDGSDDLSLAGLPDLPPPSGIAAAGGEGQVTISWLPVAGAVGYLVHRGASPAGPFAPVDHHGMDVLAVPRSPYVDTTGEIGTDYWYCVASLPEVTVVGVLGPSVEAQALPGTGTPPELLVSVDTAATGLPLSRPWEAMIGSERLSQLLCEDTTGGRPVGAELREALRLMRVEVGVAAVRAHAIFHDDTRVYSEVDDVPGYDFSVVDEIYDTVLAVGMRPVVELGFMPRDLASDPSRTVFTYGAIISPPKVFRRWGDLVRAFTAHLVDRYGRDEVVSWDFEVWNEANLEVFWSGTKDEWFHLYDVTAAAVKSVDERIAVGGPSSAAAGWVDDLLAHCATSGSPVDFISTHTYGSPPLDVRASAVRHGFPDARILWTEWGVTPKHFNPVNDSVFAGVFLLAGMHSAAGTIDALSYWVASDHFEELGRPPRLLHGGFGLLTVGNLPKPRFHAMRMLARLGEVELPVALSGDGAGSLVQAWASRNADGGVCVLLWNLTLDQQKSAGDPVLSRRVVLRLPGLTGSWEVRQSRLDAGHGDIEAAALATGLGEWPADETQWGQLAASCELEVTGTRVTAAGTLSLELTLDMPAAVLVELVPAPPG